MSDEAECPAPAEVPPDPDLAVFDEVCTRLAGFDPVRDTEWVDGYLTAVAASWRIIPVDEWLPVLGGDAFERAFADPHDVTRATLALTRRLDRLRERLDAQALIDDPDRLRLDPLMNEWDDDARRELVDAGYASADEAAALLTGQVWAAGFLQATLDHLADWPDPDDRDEDAAWYAELLRAIEMLSGEPDDDYRAYLAEWTEGPPTRDAVIDAALFAAQDLRLYWLDHPPRIAPRRVETTPGRNDPCPCGSGKKYKKCHGAAA